ncbi:protein FAM110C [Amblyraja radiata]|uniref:protein FAM110C n=1 Tax=Amblyraja radiata TaxID=386614 RepID=UPI001403CB78|nr:protein FAM110C [Amblyraja radiata]
MPSEIAPTASMPPEASVSLPLRLLTKGPGYLRSQMEGDRRGRQSAVERLAADKSKYVKSQTARGCKVEPNGLGSSASEEGSSSGSGASSNTKTYLAAGSPQQSGQLGLPSEIVRRSSSKRLLRPDSLVMYRQKCEFVRGAATTNSARSFKGSGNLVRRLLPGSSGRGDKQQGPATGAATSEGGKLAEGTEAAAPHGTQVSTPAALQRQTAASPAARRGAQISTPAASPATPRGSQVSTPAALRGQTAGSPATPRGAQVSTPAAPKGASVTTPAAPREAAAATPAASQDTQVTTPAAPREAATGRPKEPLKRRVGEGGLRRSHSDLSCRFSRACSGLDSFFEHCGLEPEVIENLAGEKFATDAAFESLALKFRSVSCPDSESEPSRHSSSDSGNEPLRGKNKPPSSALSVIERNARVIQWLYGCKRAKEPKGKAPSVLV